MSAEFIGLSRTAQKATVTNYFMWMSEANSNRSKEMYAVIVLQRMWRGYNARKYVNFLHAMATEFKRIWRGYKGRLRAKERARERVCEMEEAFYNHCATNIQRVFRGYRSRKDKHNYYQRKKYINFVTGKALDLNQEVIAEMSLYEKYLNEKQEREEAREFEKVTAGMHHLTSTFSQKGVFNSVYGEEYATTAFGLPLEDHIYENTMNELYKRKTMKQRAAKETRRAKRTQEAKESEDETTIRMGQLKVVGR